VSWLGRFVDATLVAPVPRDHHEPDHAFRRRRVVAAVTLAVGATLLGFSLATRPGDPLFYVLTLALAATWLLGALVSGPLHAGHIEVGGRRRRPVLQPVALGLVAVGVFCVGALVVAQVPFLRSSVDSVLDHARYAALPLIALVTVVNGVAEELFFRGALYAAIGRRHPVLVSTVIYTLTTVATGNVMLVFSAAVLGLLVGAQRRVTGGVLAPVLTHVTWSLGMLLVLPPLMTALT
jgi:membrane protease YdiL (CAAX protease family)